MSDRNPPGVILSEAKEAKPQAWPLRSNLHTSGFTDEDVIGRGILEEGRPFLQKRFTPHELARAVREALDAVAAAWDLAAVNIEREPESLRPSLHNPSQ